MASNGWEQASEWAKKANGIGPTIVGGSKKHGGADLGPTRAKQAWSALGVNGKGIADSAPLPGEQFEVGPKLTLEMVAKLQGWGGKDLKWKFAGKKTSIYRQIGNAFPPPVARALGISIAAALNRTASRRETIVDRTVADPVYKALRDSGTFMTAEQILKRAKINLAPHELDCRLSTLSRDFEVERVQTKSGWTYKLGEFKAFVGQTSHSRHTFYEENIRKVS